MTVSIHTRTGNINTFFRSINPYAQWLSQYIHSVAILVQSLEILNHMPISIHTPIIIIIIIIIYALFNIDNLQLLL